MRASSLSSTNFMATTQVSHKILHRAENFRLRY